jgi:hypothetical protein
MLNAQASWHTKAGDEVFTLLKWSDNSLFSHEAEMRFKEFVIIAEGKVCIGALGPSQPGEHTKRQAKRRIIPCATWRSGTQLRNL